MAAVAWRGNVISLLRGGSLASLLVRRLLPATLGLPVLVGMFCIAGERLGLVSPTPALAITIALAAAGATALLLWTAASLERVDAERRRAEEALRRSTEQHRALARNFPDGAIVLFDRDLRHVIADGIGLASVGLSSAMMEGKTIWEVFPAALCATIEPSYRAALAGTESTFEYQHLDRTFLVRVVPVQEEASGLVSGGAVMVRDVSEAKRAEAELRQAGERLARVFDAAPIGEAVVATDGRFLHVNHSLCELVGYSRDELLAGTFQQITHPDDLDADLALVRQVLDGEIRSYQLEKRYLKKDGGVAWVLLSVSLVRDEHNFPLHFIAQVEDISERKRADELEEQLRHSQKLEAVGQLAGGVAHEFNNMLMAITAYSGLLLGRLEPESPLRHDVEQIQGAADRGASVTRQLLAFGRKQMLRPQVVDLNEVADASLAFLRPLVDSSIALEARLDPDVPAVTADPAQIEQVLMNLVLNARDAIGTDGTVTIGTGTATVSESTAAREQVEPGRYVTLSVADTGRGMDGYTRSKIFEPFFTTKEPGEGTGLGLSTAHGIVQQSGGFISVESEEDAGATLTVFLPVSARAVAEVAVGRPPLEEPDQRARVVVAEDEDVVRIVCAELLDRLDYHVITAEDGPEALDIFRREPGRIDLLLTDMVMPSMGGRELALEVESLHPETKVIYMSGFTEQLFGDEAPGESVHFLQKPFSSEELERSVRNVLGDSAPADLPASLTARECQVLRLVAEGHTNDQTGDLLAISAETVQTHVRNAMKKLGAETRTQAVASALRQSLIA
jgi:two-component system, cell cycle sensor histidine kinase and response regulator CckA